MKNCVWIFMYTVHVGAEFLETPLVSIIFTYLSSLSCSDEGTSLKDKYLIWHHL